jgi:hypothetical protein
MSVPHPVTIPSRTPVSRSTPHYVLDAADVEQIQQEVDGLFSQLEASIPEAITYRAPKMVGIDPKGIADALLREYRRHRGRPPSDDQVVPIISRPAAMDGSELAQLVADVCVLLEQWRVRERTEAVERIRSFLRRAGESRVRTNPETVTLGELTGIKGAARRAMYELIDQVVSPPGPSHPIEIASPAAISTVDVSESDRPRLDPRPSVGLDNWHKVKPGIQKTPRFELTKRSVWVANHPREARLVFAESLLARFEYDLRAVRSLEEGFSRASEQEITNWNCIFWTAFDATADPDGYYLFKIYPHGMALPRELQRFWYLPDGRTRRVYKLQDLANNPKEYRVFEGDEDDWESPAILGVSNPNIGP